MTTPVPSVLYTGTQDQMTILSLTWLDELFNFLDAFILIPTLNHSCLIMQIIYNNFTLKLEKFPLSKGFPLTWQWDIKSFSKLYYVGFRANNDSQVTSLALQLSPCTAEVLQFCLLLFLCGHRKLCNTWLLLHRISIRDSHTSIFVL